MRQAMRVYLQQYVARILMERTVAVRGGEGGGGGWSVGEDTEVQLVLLKTITTAQVVGGSVLLNRILSGWTRFDPFR